MLSSCSLCKYMRSLKKKTDLCPHFRRKMRLRGAFSAKIKAPAHVHHPPEPTHTKTPIKTFLNSYYRAKRKVCVCGSMPGVQPPSNSTVTVAGHIQSSTSSTHINPIMRDENVLFNLSLWMCGSKWVVGVGQCSIMRHNGAFLL